MIVLYFVLENSLRKKWKYLREQFCVELGKVSSTSGEDLDSIKWPYFRPLSFLKDVVKPRQTSSGSDVVLTVPVDPASINGEVKEESQDTIVEGYGSEPEYFCSAPSLQEGSISHTPISNPRKRFRSSEHSNYQETEKRGPRFLKTGEEIREPDDEDLLFFRSLLPHVRHIQPAQKLLLRRKILEVVSNFLYSDSD